MSSQKTQIEISRIDKEKITLSQLTSPQGEFQWRKATLKLDGKPFIVKSSLVRSCNGIQRFQGSKMAMYICMNPDNEWVDEERSVKFSDIHIAVEAETVENGRLKEVGKKVRHLLNKQLGKKCSEEVKLLRQGKDDESLSIYCDLREGVTCLKMEEKDEDNPVFLSTKQQWEELMNQHLVLSRFSLVLNHVSLSKGNPPVIKATLGVAEVKPFMSYDFSKDFLELEEED